jgi:hypothetical protein
MHRDPAFSNSGQFVAGMKVQVTGGTVFGGGYFTLSTVGVVLGVTPLDWMFTAGAPSFAPPCQLVTPKQLEAVPNVCPPIDKSIVTANSFAYMDGFETPVGSPYLAELIANYWQFNFVACWIDPTTPPSAGSFVNVAIELFRDWGTGGEQLFVFEQALDLTIITPTPLQFSQIGPAANLGLSDRLVAIPGIHTNSTTPVKLWLRFNDPMRGTYITAPFNVGAAPSTTAPSTDASWFDVTIVGGVISGFSDHRNLRVHGAGPLVGIDTSSLDGSSASLTLLFVDTASITGNGTPSSGAAILTKKVGASYQQMNCDPGDVVSFSLSSSGSAVVWQFAGGS